MGASQLMQMALYLQWYQKIMFRVFSSACYKTSSSCGMADNRDHLGLEVYKINEWYGIFYYSKEIIVIIVHGIQD